MKKLIVVFCLLVTIACGLAYPQTTKDEFWGNPANAGGLYTPYVYTAQRYTTAPEGFAPFYISHYGRHGSRWVISPDCHIIPLRVLAAADSAGKLTETGKAVLHKLRVAAADAAERYGDLTPLGGREQRGIAERMHTLYPQVFSGQNSGKMVYARSTQVPRCIVSMAEFTARLKELQPTLPVVLEASKRNGYLNNEPAINRDTVKALVQGFTRGAYHPARLLGVLFTDNAYAAAAIADPANFGYQLFSAAINLPNIDYLGITLLDIFTPDEQFVLWQITNMHMFYLVGPSQVNGSTAEKSATLLLKNILDCADSALNGGNVAADLRFGHDSYIIPLLALMEVNGLNKREQAPEGVYRVWSSYAASPMGANLQLVFYRNAGEVLVKLLLHEREASIPVATTVAPYYRWSDVREFLRKKAGI